MTVDVLRRPAPADRRARVAVAVLFFTNGALFANLLPRYPQIKADLGIDNAAYGLAVAAFPAGAIAAGLGAGILVRRFGSARVAVGGTLLTGAGILAAGLAPTVAVFAGALFLAGAMDAFTDVAQNAHGLRVQRRYGRSVINSFHAVWSIGAVTGGSMAAAAIALGVPRGPHLLFSAAVFAVAACVALRYCLPGPEGASESAGEAGTEDRAPSPARAPARGLRTGWVLAALVLVATTAALAASGYVALVGAQFVGRIVGDRLVDRFGQRAVARSGALIAAVGMGLALAVPTVPGTVLGFAAAGFGVATLVPAAMHDADELPGLRPGTGLTLVSWLMRLGFLLSPPVVGLVADATSLRAGLLVVPLAGLVVLVCGGVLQPRRH
jgi:MFS family permease